MLDFAHDAASAWLTELQPNTSPTDWPPSIRAIETRPGVCACLIDLGTALNNATETDAVRLAALLRDDGMRNELAIVLAQLGAARIMQLLHWLAETNLPECHLIIAGLLRGDDASHRSLQSLIVAVTCRATLDRMFSPARIEALGAACNALEKENPA